MNISSFQFMMKIRKYKLFKEYIFLLYRIQLKKQTRRLDYFITNQLLILNFNLAIYVVFTIIRNIYL